MKRNVQLELRVNEAEMLYKLAIDVMQDRANELEREAIADIEPILDDIRTLVDAVDKLAVAICDEEGGRV